MAKSSIYIKPSKRGTFTSAAKKRGMGVQSFASKVLANKESYSPAMVKKANFARNAAKWKKEFGGYIDSQLGAELIDTPVGLFQMGGDLEEEIKEIKSEGIPEVFEDIREGEPEDIMALRHAGVMPKLPGVHLKKYLAYGGKIPQKPSLSTTGLAANKSPKDYDEKQLRLGIDVEHEHTGNNALALKIAMDHLEEDPQYYSQHPDPEKAAQMGASKDASGYAYGGLLPEYAYGSWLSDNAGSLLKGAGSVVSVIPGIGQIAGPILSVAGSVTDSVIAKKKAEEAEAQATFQEGVDQRRSRLQADIADQPSYAPTFEFGGMINHSPRQNLPIITQYSDKADDHSEGIGGIPVDSKGNPSAVSRQSAVGLTERGEVTWNGYVFSNKLKV